MPEIDADLLGEFKDSVEKLKAAQDKAREYEAQVAEQEKRFLDMERALKAVQESQQERAIIKSTKIDKRTKLPMEFSAKFVEWFGAVIKKEAAWLQENYGNVRTKADLGTTPDAQGGYLVPEGFWNEIWRVMVQNSVYVQDCRRLPMVTQTMLYPAQGNGWTVEWPDEAAAITAGEPTYGQINFVGKKVASFGKISRELEMYSGPDIMADLLIGAVESVAMELDRVGFNGVTPTDVADGLLAWAGNDNVIAAAGGVFEPTYQEIIDGVYKLTTQTLRGARFYMSPGVFGKIKGLVDSQGAPIWVPTAGSPDSNTIVGFPYTLVDAMPSLADEAVSTAFMLFGNLGYIPYGDIQGFRFERSDEFLFQNDQIALKYTRFIAFPDITNAAEVPKVLVKWTSAAV